MDVHFIASVAVITADPLQSRRLYMHALGLPLQAAQGDDYFHSESIGGSKHFGVWPLTQAAQACFGTDTWPGRPANPASQRGVRGRGRQRGTTAAQVLRDAGYTLLHRPHGAVGSDRRTSSDDRRPHRRHLLRALASSMMIGTARRAEPLRVSAMRHSLTSIRHQRSTPFTSFNGGIGLPALMALMATSPRR